MSSLRKFQAVDVKGVKHAIVRQPSSCIKPRSANQLKYVQMLQLDTPYIVVGTGSAGSGKTMLSTLVGMEKLKQGKVKKMIITRPAVSVDEEHGFLPGDLNAKLEPWMRPVFDVMQNSFSMKDINDMIRERVIEVCSLAHMRGRTFNDAYIICDEAQNATKNQMLMVLTRIGNNSKLVITGDLMQHDRGFDQNGLLDLINRIEKYQPQDMGVVEFGVEDIVRHPIITTVLEIYKTF